MQEKRETSAEPQQLKQDKKSKGGRGFPIASGLQTRMPVVVVASGTNICPYG